jgi:hypothetical protein
MNFDRVTITGADDSVSVAGLLELSREFPFVEWGILVSMSHGGVVPFDPRFPSNEWIRRLQEATRPQQQVQLSLHVCGHWTRQLLLGINEIPLWLLHCFQRVQLNFHAENTHCRPAELHQALLALGPRQFIVQIDGALGNQHLQSVYAVNAVNDVSMVDAVPLFDVSGGAGIVPSEWPQPQYMNTDVEHCYHGYAGGLGPDNLEEQLPLIGAAAGNTRIWIDMETNVRSDHDRKFDLAKVRRCLEISRPFIRAHAMASA